MGIKPSKKWMQTSEKARDAFRNAVAERRATGKDVIALEAGDPVVWGFTYQSLSDYLVEAAKEGWHMYPHSTSWENDLKTAIAAFEKKYRGAEYSSENIVVAPGVASVFSVLHYALLDQGDEVVAPDPSHYLTGPTSYLSYLGSKVTRYRTLENKDWAPDLDEMKNLITDQTKGIFVNSPNNPTGAVYDEKTLKEIINIAGQHDIPVISDEIYSLITFDGVKSLSMPTLSKDVPVIMLSGMSKFFMRTGWRVGHLCVHDPKNTLTDVTKVIKRVAKTYGHGTTCMATPILAAAARVYTHAVERGLPESEKMVRELESRRNYTMKRFREMTGISCNNPKGTLYAFPKIRGIGKTWKTDRDFMLDLVKEEGVLMDSGSAYGRLGESHIRTLLMPKMEILEKVYDRLGQFLRKRNAQ